MNFALRPKISKRCPVLIPSQYNFFININLSRIKFIIIIQGVSKKLYVFTKEKK